MPNPTATLPGTSLGRQVVLCFSRASLETHNGPGMNVKVLEDRESLQIAVKEIMEKIVHGNIDSKAAALLLRAQQIANSTLKPKRVHVRPRRKPASETGRRRGLTTRSCRKLSGVTRARDRRDAVDISA
jgi:hypothetical protein